MWPDNETTDDLFGFQVHADLIRAVVLNPKMQPVTVGVFGDWGGGKTSIMRMLERDLSPDNWEKGSLEAIQCENTAVVYINTWQFEGYDDAKAALLTSVLQQLNEHKRFGASVRTRALKLLKGINAMRLVRFSLKYGALPAAAAVATGGAAAVPAAVIAALGLTQFFAADAQQDAGQSGGPSVDDLNALWKGMPQDEAIDVRTFRKEFAGLLKDAKIDTLVVLIDDLDRCSPERIVENLEAVKLFLSVDGMAFVIGADRRIVEHAIRSRYARPASDERGEAKRMVAQEAEDRLVRDYLEKLVQVPYTIPRLSAAEIETYITLLFCGIHLECEDMRVCVTAAHAARKVNRYAAFGYGAVKDALTGRTVPTTLTARLSLAATASPLMADGLKGNPRQVKRFLNALMLRLELARVAGLEDAIKTEKLVKLMILEYVEPDLFMEMFNRIGPDGRVPFLAALETPSTKGQSKHDDGFKDLLPNWTSAWTTRWASMEPALADTDLRDYFWVSRDRLASTFSGITMVAPIVRTVIADFATGLSPKRNQAVRTAAKLTADERAAMYRLLEQDVASRPSVLAAYEPLRALAEADVDGAAAVFARVLSSQPATEIPGAVGLWAIELRDRKPAYRDVLAPVIEQLCGTDTKVGKAIASARV